LDVHREFCEVAISEEGQVRRAGRIRTRRDELALFAGSLGRDDEVALESTGGAEAIARILRAHVARVVVVNTKKLRAISEAKAKTDRLDARRLAELLASCYLAEVWCPDEGTRSLRRYVARRAQLVRQRTRAKNEIGAALQRNLLDRPEVYDLAGKKGRRHLEGLELPEDERNTVEGCLRQISFLDEEIAQVDRAIAKAALGSPEMRRLMTVPGVNLHTSASGSDPARCRHRQGRGRPQARGAVLAPAHQGGGLRLRQAHPGPQEAPPARAHCRRPAGPGPARRLGGKQGAARGRA